MAQVKGIAILGLVKYVKKNLKDKGIEDFLGMLEDEDDRVIFQKRLLPTEWYPYKTFVNLLTLADKYFGKGDMSFAREQGRLNADADLAGVYKAFVKVGPTKFFVKRVMNIWKSYYDSGNLELIDVGEKKWHIRFSDFPEVKRIHCRNIEGWIERFLELCGAKGVKVNESQCRTKGAPFCQFDVEFESL